MRRSFPGFDSRARARDLRRRRAATAAAARRAAATAAQYQPPPQPYQQPATHSRATGSRRLRATDSRRRATVSRRRRLRAAAAGLRPAAVLPAAAAAVPAAAAAAAYAPPEPPEPPTHAPKFSLWVGPRLSYMGFGFSFVPSTRAGQVRDDRQPRRQRRRCRRSTSARASRTATSRTSSTSTASWPHGHRFDGDRRDGARPTSTASASATSSGDVDSVAFFTDIVDRQARRRSRATAQHVLDEAASSSSASASAPRSALATLFAIDADAQHLERLAERQRRRRHVRAAPSGDGLTQPDLQERRDDRSLGARYVRAQPRRRHPLRRVRKVATLSRRPCA